MRSVPNRLENSNNSYLFDFVHFPPQPPTSGKFCQPRSSEDSLPSSGTAFILPILPFGKESRTIGIRAAGSIRATPEEVRTDTSPWP